MQTTSLGGSKYFLSFVDDYSRYTFIYFLHKKVDTFQYFLEYKALIQNQTGQKILILRSDNGGEFTSNKFTNYCFEHGIHRHLINPYTPSQNGVAEQKNHTLVKSARSMLRAANLPNSYWAEASAQ